MRSGYVLLTALLLLSARASADAEPVVASAPLPPIAEETAFAETGVAITPAEMERLRAALQADATRPDPPRPPTLTRRPAPKAPTRDLAVDRDAAPDGSGSVKFSKPLATEWDVKVGAELGYNRDGSLGYQPDRPIVSQTRSNAAWASIGVTDYATVDARVDPGNEQGRLGGIIKHAIPMGDTFSLTLQNTSGVNSSFGAPTASAPAGLPVMALPQDLAQGPTRVWDTQQAVKFNILPTGTTLSAGVSNSTIDPVTRNRLSAEQKLFDNLHITTAVSDIGQAQPNKSIGATYKLAW